VLLKLSFGVLINDKCGMNFSSRISANEIRSFPNVNYLFSIYIYIYIYIELTSII